MIYFIALLVSFFASLPGAAYPAANNLCMEKENWFITRECKFSFAPYLLGPSLIKQASKTFKSKSVQLEGEVLASNLAALFALTWNYVALQPTVEYDGNEHCRSPELYSPPPIYENSSFPLTTHTGVLTLLPSMETLFPTSSTKIDTQPFTCPGPNEEVDLSSEQNSAGVFESTAQILAHYFSRNSVNSTFTRDQLPITHPFYCPEKDIFCTRIHEKAEDLIKKESGSSYLPTWLSTTFSAFGETTTTAFSKLFSWTQDLIWNQELFSIANAKRLFWEKTKAKALVKYFTSFSFATTFSAPLRSSLTETFWDTFREEFLKDAIWRGAFNGFETSFGEWYRESLQGLMPSPERINKILGYFYLNDGFLKQQYTNMYTEVATSDFWATKTKQIYKLTSKLWRLRKMYVAYQAAVLLPATGGASATLPVLLELTEFVVGHALKWYITGNLL